MYYFLYRDASFFLERKHLLFREAVDFFEAYPAFYDSLVLTREQVEEIRVTYAAGFGTHRSLGKEYGVNPSTIRQVVLRLVDAYNYD